MAHITEAEWQGMRDGALCGNAYLSALAHIGECDQCALHLAEQMEERPLLDAPKDVRGTVKRRLREPSEEAVKNYKAYRRRVLLAMCATLILVFSSAFVQFGRVPVDKINQANSSLSAKIKEGFSSFSQKLWIMEDHANEKAKK